jgi:AraC family transcriptional regulator
VFSLMSEGWALQALAHITRVSEKDSDEAHLHRGGMSGRKLNLIDEFVRENLASPISIAQLAELAGLSKRHFLRAFQQRVGASPYRFVQDLRIEEAKRRLRHTKEPITEIALETGFAHSQHFSARFRTATGMSPTSYREKSLP